MQNLDSVCGIETIGPGWYAPANMIGIIVLDEGLITISTFIRAQSYHEVATIFLLAVEVDEVGA